MNRKENEFENYFRVKEGLVICWMWVKNERNVLTNFNSFHLANWADGDDTSQGRKYRWQSKLVKRRRCKRVRRNTEGANWDGDRRGCSSR